MTEPTSSKLVMMTKTDEFSSVFSFRRRYASEHLVIHYRPSELAQARVGFVVAKKIAKHAVDRNYMRRVLRELCRQELSVLQHVDTVIQVRRSFKHDHFLPLKKELSTLFGKIQHKIVQEK